MMWFVRRLFHAAIPSMPSGSWPKPSNTFGEGIRCTAIGAEFAQSDRRQAVYLPLDGTRIGSAYSPAGGRGTRTLPTTTYLFGGFRVSAQPAAGWNRPA